MASSSVVDVEHRDGIAIVRLDRPEKLNAVTLELLEAFREALVELDDDAVDGLVLSGTGSATCAGMDRDIVSDEDYDEKYGDQIDQLNAEVYEFLDTRPYPTVMAAHGALVGIGFVISLRCDFFIAGEDATISLPEIQYDISTAGSIPYLEQLVGVRAAKEIAYTGEPIAPERAYELGLANEVVPDADVEEAAVELVSQIGEYDSDVVAELKAASSVPE